MSCKYEDTNPVAGQDLLLTIPVIDKCEVPIDLTGATVTIKYKIFGKPTVSGIVPDSIDYPNGILTWNIPKAITVEGVWDISIDADGAAGLSIGNKPIRIEFDRGI